MAANIRCVCLADSTGFGLLPPSSRSGIVGSETTLGWNFTAAVSYGAGLTAPSGDGAPSLMQLLLQGATVGPSLLRLRPGKGPSAPEAWCFQGGEFQVTCGGPGPIPHQRNHTVRQGFGSLGVQDQAKPAMVQIVEAQEICLHLVAARPSRLDCVVYDRACRCVQQGRKDTRTKQIKRWCVDRFHAKGHAIGSPPPASRLEQSPGRASTPPLPSTHVLGFVAMPRSSTRSPRAPTPVASCYALQRHNDLTRQGYQSHLSPFSTRKPAASCCG